MRPDRCKRQGSFCLYCGYRACLKAEPVTPGAANTQALASGNAEVAFSADGEGSREANEPLSPRPLARSE